MTATILKFPQPRLLSKQAEADFVLEMRIDMAHEMVLLAGSLEEQRRWFLEMTTLIKQRSPEQVARMEKQKGLA